MLPRAADNKLHTWSYQETWSSPSQQSVVLVLIIIGRGDARTRTPQRRQNNVPHSTETHSIQNYTNYQKLLSKLKTMTIKRSIRNSSSSGGSGVSIMEPYQKHPSNLGPLLSRNCVSIQDGFARWECLSALCTYAVVFFSGLIDFYVSLCVGGWVVVNKVNLLNEIIIVAIVTDMPDSFRLATDM